MNDISKAGYFHLGDRKVYRLGYGAMQLAGPHVFGPPNDRNAGRIQPVDATHLQPRRYKKCCR